MERIVIALGGNALGNTYLEQQDLIKKSARNLADLFKDNEIIITHGNGPQVGMITKSFADGDNIMPLDCCTAMSDGYIGFHIQREIKEVLNEKNIDRDIVTLITEVLVDENDSSFKNPTKPIGKFYSKEKAEELSKLNGDIYVEDSGRGYRKVVASPVPVDISNLKAIKKLVECGIIVVACGGGGIPIFKNVNTTKVEAVIDKDLASALLAEKMNADKLIILTTVNQVMLNFGTDNEIPLSDLSIQQAKQYLENDEFKKGSMYPKIKAAISFVEKTGNEAIITSLSNINGIINNTNITVIHK